MEGDNLLDIHINHVLNGHLQAQRAHAVQMHPGHQRMNPFVREQL
jgi:hypothetical protein